ncbi:SLAP domain-containing protein [Fictibacillus gelatini]|uniref:SLAP domain-containing protein n=1 Tax=Fictibacillus gelatini TaxID=225985 RepID=UPI000424E11D|nr:SLAP domain-containing protein [Fictibacillus gelatini]
MQQLLLEESWEKAISQKDRTEIERAFREIHNGEGITFTPLWEAVNHKGEWLITVIINNFTRDPINFDGIHLSYVVNGKAAAGSTFYLPSLVVPGKTSMPWTFIFPVGSFEQDSVLEKGSLSIS